MGRSWALRPAMVCERAGAALARHARPDAPGRRPPTTSGAALAVRSDGRGLPGLDRRCPGARPCCGTPAPCRRAVNLRGLLFHRRAWVLAPSTRSGMADSGMPTSLRYCGTPRSSASMRSARPSSRRPRGRDRPVHVLAHGLAELPEPAQAGAACCTPWPTAAPSCWPRRAARGTCRRSGYESACTAPTPALPKAMPPIMRAHRHVVAGPHVGAVVHGGADALADQLDALVGQRVGVHGGVHRDVGLDVVDEGVHAARRR